jgi:hypothetical protein
MTKLKSQESLGTNFYFSQMDMINDVHVFLPKNGRILNSFRNGKILVACDMM